MDALKFKCLNSSPKS